VSDLDEGKPGTDRARTPVIQNGRRFLCTMRYIDLNPVRAGMVRKAKDYAWSSYRYYAYGEQDDLIDPAPDYLGLSKVAAVRRTGLGHVPSASGARQLFKNEVGANNQTTGSRTEPVALFSLRPGCSLKSANGLQLAF